MKRIYELVDEGFDELVAVDFGFGCWYVDCKELCCIPTTA